MPILSTFISKKNVPEPLSTLDDSEKYESTTTLGICMNARNEYIRSKKASGKSVSPKAKINVAS